MPLYQVLKGLIAKPVVFFTASRYFSYALLFLRGLLVAKLLGPYFFGIWGFITLYQQYLSFTSLGIQFAVNTELALLQQDDQKRRDSLINSSFTLTLIIFCIVVGVAFILQFFHIEIFKTEGSYKYIILTFLIAGLQHFRELFSNIFRVFNDYWRIAVGELLIAVVTLIVVFFFKDENLIVSLLLSWTISLAISIVIFVVNAPFKLRLSLELKEVKGLMSIGLPLLVYTISYYLMTLSSRTIISIYYDLDIVGYYTFANTITNATLLGLNVASWVFYPTILSKLKEGTGESEVRNTVSRVNNLYGVAVVLIVYLGIIFFPLFYIFLEKYRRAGTVLNILLLSQAVLSLGFVFNTLAIARKKHNQIALISLASTVLSTGLCLIFANLKMDFVWLAVSTLLSFTVYTIIICLYGFKLLGIKGFNLLEFFPFSLQFSMILFLIGSFSDYSMICYFSGLSIFIWTNRRNLMDIFNFIIKPRSKETPDVKY
jgi:O-antigen/teichoic acid export membrane protein